MRTNDVVGVKAFANVSRWKDTLVGNNQRFSLQLCSLRSSSVNRTGKEERVTTGDLLRGGGADEHVVIELLLVVVITIIVVAFLLLLFAHTSLVLPVPLFFLQKSTCNPEFCERVKNVCPSTFVANPLLPETTKITKITLSVQ